jgi:hypothetical protein
MIKKHLKESKYHFRHRIHPNIHLIDRIFDRRVKKTPNPNSKPNPAIPLPLTVTVTLTHKNCLPRLNFT